MRSGQVRPDLVTVAQLGKVHHHSVGRTSGRAADPIAVNVDQKALLGILVGQHEHVPDVHQVVREVPQVEDVVVGQDEGGSALHHVAVAT